jgi:hypothetical protein
MLVISETQKAFDEAHGSYNNIATLATQQHNALPALPVQSNTSYYKMQM